MIPGQGGHVPGLQVQFPVGVRAGGSRSMNVSLSPPSSLSTINKNVSSGDDLKNKNKNKNAFFSTSRSAQITGCPGRHWERGGGGGRWRAGWQRRWGRVPVTWKAFRESPGGGGAPGAGGGPSSGTQVRSRLGNPEHCTPGGSRAEAHAGPISQPAAARATDSADLHLLAQQERPTSDLCLLSTPSGTGPLQPHRDDSGVPGQQDL